MSAIVVSAWQTVDFRDNPYIDRPRHQSGSFDVDALRREHKRRLQTDD